VATGGPIRAPVASITRTFPVCSSLKNTRPSATNAIRTGIRRPVFHTSASKPAASVTTGAGSGGVTWTESVVWALPSALLAVTRCPAVGVAEVGVPETTPVVGSSARPAGSGGETV
jgi:hypothetical protein